MASHAKLSPSGAHRWMRCPGSIVLEGGLPDDSSPFAAEGTCAHDIASAVLTDPEYVIPVGEHYTVDGHTIRITQDMADFVMQYCKLVWEYAEGGSLLVEQRVDFSRVIGVPDSFGTSDAVILKGDELIVIDLKYGMGVPVHAENNEQLQLYALGALEAASLFSDFSHVTMVIHQPRIHSVTEWCIPVAQLQAFGAKAKDAAATVQEAISVAEHGVDSYLEAGEKQCRFCKAKASAKGLCPALQASVTEVSSGKVATAEDFAEFMPDAPTADTGDNYLSIAMSKVDLVEAWCKAVRAETERRLLAGEQVDGWKLVEGRKGNRAWLDEDAVEEMFKKSFRLRDDEMYAKKLISPTVAEKLLKDTPKRLKRAMELTTRAEGKPSVAPAADKRPALAVSNLAEEFGALVDTVKLEN